jgi:chromosome segregation ATPase
MDSHDLADSVPPHTQKQLEKLESENTTLSRENANLRHLLAQAECANIRLESHCSIATRDTQAYQNRIGDLTTQLRQTGDRQKTELRKIESAQQIDRNYYLNQIQKLQNELAIAKEANQELKNLFVKRNRECRDIELQAHAELENRKTDERAMLAGANFFFHTFFPSVNSLEEYFRAKPELPVQSGPVVQSGAPKVIVGEERVKLKLKKKIKKVESEAVQLRTANDLLRREIKASEEIENRKAEQQQAVIAEQREELERLRPLEAENERLGKQVAAAKAELRQVEPIMFWKDVEVPGFPADLRETLAKVIESDSLSTKTKYQHCFRAILAFYELRIENLSGQYERSQQATQTISGKLSHFLTLLAVETLYRSVTPSALLNDDSLHSLILDAVRKLKSDLKEALVANQRLPRSFPAEELASLRETVAGQKQQLEERTAEIAELRAQVIKPRNEIEELRAETARARHEKQFYEEELKAVKGALRHQETLKDTIARQKARIEKLEEDLTQVQESERTAYSRALSDLQFQNAVSAHELSLLHKAEADTPDDKMVEISALRRQLELSGAASEASAEQVKRLQEEIVRLRTALEDERALHVEKLKESRMKTIEEYDALVSHLRSHCEKQKATIAALSAQRSPKSRGNRST